MSKILVYLLVFGVLVAIAAFVGAWITQIVWAWVIPDVFSQMVEAELLPASLEFWQAFKLSLMLTILFGGSRASSSSKK